MIKMVARGLSFGLFFLTSGWLPSKVVSLLPAPSFEEYYTPSGDSAETLLVFDPPFLNYKVFLEDQLLLENSPSWEDGPSLKNPVGHFVAQALWRFHNFTFQYPDYPESYPINPRNLPVQTAQLMLKILTPDTDLHHGVDESYTLNITAVSPKSGNVWIVAPNVFGILRGLETLSQLVDFGWMRGENPVFVIHKCCPIAIRDEPLFPYRGLLIDTSRHYLPLSLILDNLDVMAMSKLNVLHWHIVDSQSFPYLSRKYPNLARKGAYHPQNVYTISDIQLVISEAHLRGIRVIPEFDLPGHSQAIARSHPEVMSMCPDASEPLDPTKPETYEFVDNLYQEIMSVFPDQMIHVGGDEVSLDCWKKSTSIQAYMRAHNVTDELDLFEMFENKLLTSIVGDQKQAIVWQEIFNLGLTIRKDTIVDVWKGFDKATLANATSQGYQVVLSGCWYLDHLNAPFWYPNPDWTYCHPRNFTGGNPDLVIGGHASMWGEMVDATNFMSRVWPRASVMAERLWSTDNHDVSLETRMSEFRCKLVQRGVRAQPLGPGSCTRTPSEHDVGTRWDDLVTGKEER